MVKCKNGNVKIKGDASQITAEAIVLLSELMGILFEYECPEGIDEFEKTIVGIVKTRSQSENLEFLFRDAKERVEKHMDRMIKEAIEEE